MILERLAYTKEKLLDMGYNKAELSALTQYWRKHAWESKIITSCCGFILASSWEEWLKWYQGIQVFISKEDHKLPEDTDTERYTKLHGVDGDFLYIKEQKDAHDGAESFQFYRGGLSYLPPPMPETSPYGALSFQAFLKCFEDHKKVIDSLEKEVQWVFFIVTIDQMETNGKSFKILQESLGPLVYESPEWVYNTNMGGANRLKMFIFKKEKE